MSSFTAPVAPEAVTALTPYTGPWEKEQASHLLRRTLFGPKRQEIIDAVTDGLTATLDTLLAPPTLPPPPINHFYTQDPNVGIGQTWVNSPHLMDGDVGDYRWPSLRGWYLQNLIDSPCNIMDKLAMFWINHFGMSDVGEHRAQYQYIQLFREFGTGSFKDMIEKISVHPSMLSFLNGNYSTKWQPNENYARELLELFTIQKGPQIGPGDYSNYTEADIQTIARIMTGWRTRGFWSTSEEPVESYFYEQWHDDETVANNPSQEVKQLSYHFGNAIIASNGDQEYKDLIAVIFQQPETCRAICRELYRYFVYYDITPTIESTVIVPLAQHLADNNFSIGSALRLLFSSQHFYDMAVRGPIIKNPYEYVMSIARPLNGYTHLGLSLKNNGSNMSQIQTIYEVGTSYHYWANTMDMDVYYPPTVAGWKAYYQTPNFYRNWIGSATLQQRRKMTRDFTNYGLWTRTEGGNYDPRPFDWLGFINALANPYDVNDVVQEAIEIFLPRELHPDQFLALKDQLIPGLPDSEWTIQYANYVDSPNNPDVTNPLVNKIKGFFLALFSMAEFHLQ